jgi:uncharacterized membrane protein YdbT with pleckstrin-like domain
MPEKIVQTLIYDAHPAMLRAHPFWFVAYIILIPAFGLGILLLLYWYIETRQKRVTVSDSEIVYSRGILHKARTEVSLKHIRSVNVTQGFLNRLLKVGTIQVYTAGDQPEFTVADIPLPGTVREALSKLKDKHGDKN